MRRILAPLSAVAFYLKTTPGGSSASLGNNAQRMIPSGKELIAILEGAADFIDYRSGQHFAKRVSKPASGDSALQLRDPTKPPSWAFDLCHMFSTLENFEFNSKQGSSMARLCEAGARFGWQELESAIAPELLVFISLKAKRRLKRDLQRILERATRPCLELERKSYSLALAAIGLQKTATDPKLVERRFLGNKPSERLFAMFRRFPVLSRLWLQLISQWYDQVAELLTRLAADRTALSRAFLSGQPAGSIVDMRCGLSDPHNKGRTVALLEFAAGSVIYKPRPGDGEWEWSSFLHGLNALSFRPRLKAGRVLRRKGYCWMERIEPLPCKDKAAARRFFQRLGGMIGVAYLLRAVDCHRGNIIAADEHPVLVDAEALWHVGPEAKAQTPVDLLYRTGFLPGSNRRSLQSRSSVLGGAIAGPHLPRIRDKALSATQYERQIVDGFCRAWRCVLGTRNRRAAFVRRLGRICSRKRRRIYWPTEKYAAIIRASVQPGALRSGVERDLMFSRLCSRKTVTPSVIHAEIAALKRLDIPYFTSGTTARFLLDTPSAPPAELTSALRDAL
jgi:Domain of unknown function (DUF4135)